MTTPFEFFATEPPFSYIPGKQSPSQGCARNAWALACAEQAARAAEAEYLWSVDPDVTSADWCDDEPAHRTWQCSLTVRAADGTFLFGCGIGGIDLGPDGSPSTEPYARVVKAELAHEAIKHLVEAMSTRLPKVTA